MFPNIISPPPEGRPGWVAKQQLVFPPLLGGYLFMYNKIIILLCFILFMCAAVNASAAGPNLVFNGSFDDPTNSLKGWCVNYEWEENENYMKNHMNITAETSAEGKRNVLKMFVPTGVAKHQGVKIDSAPMKYEKGFRYRVAANIKTTGPQNRIYIAGYQWKPGIKPYENPKIWDLREVYRTDDFQAHTRVGAWTKINGEFPALSLSDLAKAHLNKVTFIVVHIIAIQGEGGDFYVDDVSVEKM